MSELISKVGSESFPVLTLEDQLAKCRYSFEYPITVEVSGTTVKLVHRNSVGGRSGIALKVAEPVRVEILLETILGGVQALTNMADEKKARDEETESGRAN